MGKDPQRTGMYTGGSPQTEIILFHPANFILLWPLKFGELFLLLNTNVLSFRICLPQAFQTGNDRPLSQIFYPLKKQVCAFWNVFPQESHPHVQHPTFPSKRLCESDLFWGLTEPEINHSFGCRVRLTCRSARLLSCNQPTDPFCSLKPENWAVLKDDWGNDIR